jgi:two-component system sensor histidine kinase KdpD
MSVDNDCRTAHRDPEALLRQIEAAERAERRGPLKIFLGYASGVGKSFRLFDEGRRRHERGEDVVVAATQADSSPEVAQVLRSLEIIPTLNVEGVPVIDVPAVIARHPQVCLVDGLAYDNPPGSRHRKRHEDVEELLEAGISVLTSINIEYIAEQQEFVRGILGRTKTDTVPQAFINHADEVVVVDAPPGTQERILVCMTPRANAARMLASGRRNADRFHGELFAIYVTQDHLTTEDEMALERNATLARAQLAHVEILEGKDPIKTILEYAQEQGITQIFVGHNLRRTWRARLGGTPLDRLIRDAEGIDVRVFPQ